MRSAWERGRIPAVSCPNPGSFPALEFRECSGMLPRFGARWAVGFICCLNYLLSHSRSVFNREDATLEECLGFFFFLSVSWKKKKLPVTNYWSCRLRQTIRPCILIYISFLTQLILIFFLFARQSYTSCAKSQGVCFTCSRFKCVTRKALVANHGNSCN